MRRPRLPEVVPFDELPEPSRWSWLEAGIFIVAFSVGAWLIWAWLR